MADSIAQAKKGADTATTAPATTPRFGLDLPFFRGAAFGPYEWMKEMTKEMDRFLTQNSTIAGAWRPAIEVKEDKGRLTVTADLPGLTKDDIKVNIQGNVLTVEGERKQEKEEKREGYFHSERSYGQFYRSIPLPEGADAAKAAADLKNGTLTVTVPIPEAKQEARKVPVNDSASAGAAPAR